MQASYRTKTTTQQKGVPFAHPFAIFKSLIDTYGKESVFLLESLSGPAIDCKESMIGLFPIMDVKVEQEKVSLTTPHEDLMTTLTRSVEESDTIHQKEDNWYLKDRFALWNFLRALARPFGEWEDQKADGFTLGLFGYLGYDTAWSIERLPNLITPDEHSPPDVWLRAYQVVIKFDLENRKVILVQNECPLWPVLDGETIATIESLFTSCTAPEEEAPAAPPSPTAQEDSMAKEPFLKAVDAALEYIGIGDIYQVQIGHELRIQTSVDPLLVYERLRYRNPSPYMYFATFGDVSLIGASPELFVKVDRDEVVLRPIAGTIGRGKDLESDKANTQKLLTDPKERAEHIMLVDLCRNDISRICEYGTMEVDELLHPEYYSHLIHLVSNVKAQKRKTADALDVIAASFPAGTMTGAPKIRAMEIIEELETRRRGIYAGTVGVIGFNGYVNTALCIRTAVQKADTYLIRASAGVVADSIPDKEWQETLHKLNSCYWAITGEEFDHAYTGH